MALAVRVGAPIFVAPGVLDEAGIPTEDEEDMAAIEPGEETPEPDPEPEAPRSPLEKLEDDLAQAIADEDYELAAKLRDDISRLKGEQN